MATENNQNELETGSVGKLLFKLAAPAIVAQLVNVLYNIVDRMFIGRMANCHSCTACKCSIQHSR